MLNGGAWVNGILIRVNYFHELLINYFSVLHITLVIKEITIVLFSTKEKNNMELLSQSKEVNPYCFNCMDAGRNLLKYYLIFGLTYCFVLNYLPQKTFWLKYNAKNVL